MGGDRQLCVVAVLVMYGSVLVMCGSGCVLRSRIALRTRASRGGGVSRMDTLAGSSGSDRQFGRIGRSTGPVMVRQSAREDLLTTHPLDHHRA